MGFQSQQTAAVIASDKMKKNAEEKM